mmetsp:Transcript_25938/g.71432  ORF Transcript_25938/g.71432 Transcript_25938/m.71432 type:complete len:953 (-) Transcript_25938:1158-4016(-)
MDPDSSLRLVVEEEVALEKDSTHRVDTGLEEEVVFDEKQTREKSSRPETIDPNSADEIPGLPQATRHQDEAEEILLDTIERQQSKPLRRRTLNLKKNPPEPRRPSTLASTTQYIVALQEEEGKESKRFSSRKGSLVEEGAAERIFSAAPLFLKAAFRNSSKASYSLNNTSRSSKRSKRRRDQSPNQSEEENEIEEVASHRSSPDVENGKDHSRHSRHSNVSFHAFTGTVRRAMSRSYAASTQEWLSLVDFFKPKRKDLAEVVFIYVVACMLPCMLVAIFLFHFADNPPTGQCSQVTYNLTNLTNSTMDDDLLDPGFGVDPITAPAPACYGAEASASWWLLFIGCRQVTVWLLARGTDVFCIDFVLLQHPLFVRMMGPRLTLILLQSKGWPSVMLWWAFWASLLLYGDRPFVNHWLFFQNALRLFTEDNPSGNVTTAESYRRLLTVCAIVPICVCLKRHYVALHLGARLYSRYNARLEEIMRQVLLISELSLWARRKHDKHATYEDFLMQQSELESSLVTAAPSKDPSERESDLPSETHYSKLSEFVEPWQEPKRRNKGEPISGKHIIEFRQAFAVMTKEFFFSTAFGPVETRAECLVSSENLFWRLCSLMGDDKSGTINMDHITFWMYKGRHLPEEVQKAADFDKLFVSDAKNQIHLIDFVGAIDGIYKKLRLLENAVDNASHIDNSYEKVINFVFYLFIGCFGLAVLGLNPLAFVVSISTIVVSFGFMIGSGTSQLFEGVMMVLARQPYDIGDKIAIAEVETLADLDGSQHWMVESIDLVTTVGRLVGTGEVASFSNGALARARLMNMARSPNAVVYVHVRFEINVPYSKILIFRAAVEKFVEERPAEWVELIAFCTNRVEAEQNFVEYSIMLRHQLAWQKLIPIKESRGAVASFCVEAQKQLGCRYRAPPMDVHISKSTEGSAPTGNITEEEAGSLNRLLELAKGFGSTD